MKLYEIKEMTSDELVKRIEEEEKKKKEEKERKKVSTRK